LLASLRASRLIPRIMSKPATYWMVKQEPTAYAWADFEKDGRAAWTGVRNFQARNNLRAMRKGDRVLYYHSVVGKEIVGIASVAREAYPDPTAESGDWSCVDLVPLKALPQPVPLAAIKASAKLKDIALLRQSRLSVMPVTAAEFAAIEALARGT
jgi:predicted RNA-binding protein with PUA-like domain